VGAALACGAVLAATRPWRRAALMPSAPSAVASSAPKPSPRPAGPAELALVAPLMPGSSLLDFTVREIHAVDRGRLRVVCGKDKAVVRLDVALLDAEGAVVPPASAGRYAVFYSLRGGAPEDGDRLARALAHLIGAHASAPPPPGMTTFTPEERPATEL
jgi:hypothetical protein